VEVLSEIASEKICRKWRILALFGQLALYKPWEWWHSSNRFRNRETLGKIRFFVIGVFRFCGHMFCTQLNL